MNKKELLELIKTGEGYTLEFKENYSSSIDKEICAFANANGGRILLGVKDDNSIINFSPTNTFASQIQSIARNIEPYFSVDFEMIDTVGVISIPEGKNKPYSVRGKHYLRQGASSQRLNRDELINFLRNCNKISFEKQINKDFNMKEDFNKKKFESFIEKANISKTLSTNHILKNLNLLTENKSNNACVLLFPHRVTKFFLSADISCVLYSGNSKLSMLDKKEFNADFISNFENALNFILRNIKTKAEIIGVRRVETPEIPEKALREAILNAMIHKDYFIEGRILINIFANKIEILNPGKLLFDKKELGNISVTRNPIIADCMLRAGFVEKIGSGIKRILELTPNVKFKISSNWFSVIFNRENEVKRKIGIQKFKITKNELKNKKISKDILIDYLGADWEKVGSKLGVNQLKIIIVMSAKKEITIKELSSELEISTTAIENNIKKLKEAKLLKRIGGDKEGTWEILK